MVIATDHRLQRYYRALIIVGTILIISWLYPVGSRFEYRYDRNEITSEAIIAPFNFPILKSQATLEQERETARRSVPLLFHPDQTISTEQLAGLRELFNRVNRIRRAEEKLTSSRDRAYRHRYDDRAVATQQTVLQDSLTVVELGNEFSQRFPLDINGPHWTYFFRGS
ncbi:MAG: hypothetical protein IH972_02155, partial [Candidatus Marinimicrobia bacterium]|nr:hypothetical protein [Candidatus Neomarinimicrobiota bacterium]